MRNDIKFAGIAMSWTKEYAQSYLRKLFEMGYNAKCLEDSIVAYSHKPFSKSEAIESFTALKKDSK